MMMMMMYGGLPRLHSGKKKKKPRLPVQETQEMQFLSQDQEDPLEQEMATHSSVLAWRIP